MRQKLLRNILLASTICAIAGLASAKRMLIPLTTVTPAVISHPEPTPQLLAAIGQLAAQEYATRETGQKFIDTLSLDQHDTLKDLLARQSDPEVISRLQRRLEEMDSELAIDPPPLTLHLQNADPAALNQALANQLQLPIQARIFPGTKFDLDIDRKPFADVWAVLSEKNAQILPRMMALPPRIKTYETYKGFTIYFAGIDTVSEVGPGGDASKSSTLSIGAMADPRIHVLGISPPLLTKVTDSAGNVIIDRNSATPISSLLDPTLGYWMQASTLVMPEKPGDKLASVKGEARFRVLVQGETLTIDDLAKQVGRTFSVAGNRFTLGQFKDDATSISIQLDQKDPLNPPLPFEIEISSQNGAPVWHRSHTSEAQITLQSNIVSGPVQLKLTAASKTRDITIPFELKDHPYPH